MGLNGVWVKDNGVTAPENVRAVRFFAIDKRVEVYHWF